MERRLEDGPATGRAEPEQREPSDVGQQRAAEGERDQREEASAPQTPPAGQRQGHRAEGRQPVRAAARQVDVQLHRRVGQQRPRPVQAGGEGPEGGLGHDRRGQAQREAQDSLERLGQRQGEGEEAGQRDGVHGDGPAVEPQRVAQRRDVRHEREPADEVDREHLPREAEGRGESQEPQRGAGRPRIRRCRAATPRPADERGDAHRDRGADAFDGGVEERTHEPGER